MYYVQTLPPFATLPNIKSNGISASPWLFDRKNRKFNPPGRFPRLFHQVLLSTWNSAIFTVSLYFDLNRHQIFLKLSCLFLQPERNEWRDVRQVFGYFMLRLQLLEGKYE